MLNNAQQRSVFFVCLSPILCHLPISFNIASKWWLAMVSIAQQCSAQHCSGMLKNALQNYPYLENSALAGFVRVNSMFILVLKWILNVFCQILTTFPNEGRWKLVFSSLFFLEKVLKIHFLKKLFGSEKIVSDLTFCMITSDRCLDFSLSQSFN